MFKSKIKNLVGKKQTRNKLQVTYMIYYADVKILIKVWMLCKKSCWGELLKNIYMSYKKKLQSSNEFRDFLLERHSHKPETPHGQRARKSNSFNFLFCRIFQTKRQGNLSSSKLKKQTRTT
jgi:hypothetical protein